MKSKSRLILTLALFLVSAFAIAGSVSSSPPSGGSTTATISNWPDLSGADGGLPVNTSMTISGLVTAVSVGYFTDGGCTSLPSLANRKTVQIQNNSTTAEVCIGIGATCPVLGGACFVVPARTAGGVSSSPGFWAGNLGSAVPLTAIANGSGDAGITLTEGR